MICNHCGGKSRVMQTRLRNNKLCRERQCDDCLRRHWTVEVPMSREAQEAESLLKAKDVAMGRVKKAVDDLNILLTNDV